MTRISRKLVLHEMEKYLEELLPLKKRELAGVV